MFARTLLALCVLCSSLFAGAQRYVFRDHQSHQALGFIDGGKRNSYGHGWLAVGGWVFPLMGFDSWKYSWVDYSSSLHMCLVRHPVFPWVIGLMVWKGDHGLLDFFSTDGQRFEFTLDILIEPDQENSEEG